MRPTPCCWSDAFSAHIDNHDNRQTVVSIKKRLHGSQQVCLTQELMRNAAFLVRGHNIVRRMLSMVPNRRHFLYVAVCCLDALLQTTNAKLLYFFIFYLTVWGVEPVVTHQTSWLESTGVCGVQQNQAGESSVQK